MKGAQGRAAQEGSGVGQQRRHLVSVAPLVPRLAPAPPAPDSPLLAVCSLSVYARGRRWCLRFRGKYCTLRSKPSELIYSRFLLRSKSIADAIKSLITPTPEGDWFSSSVYTNGNPYGIVEDIIFSMPCRSAGDGSWELVTDCEVDEYLRERIQKSEDKLFAEKKCVAHLIGLDDGYYDLPEGDTMLPGEL